MNKKDKVASKNKVSEKRKEVVNNKKILTHKFKDEFGHLEEFEDTTKYGEFVSSYFAWLTLEKQKENARYMENIINKNNK